MNLSEMAFAWRAQLRERILAELKAKGPMPVKQVMAAVNASRNPIDRALTLLRREGKVRYAIGERRGRGMPPTVYFLP